MNTPHAYDDQFYDDDPDKLFGLYTGTVVKIENDPNDPNAEELPYIGRIKFVIPGLIEPESVWALPFGAGGSAQEGRNYVPPVGADVYCMFVNGDPDQPVWAPGWHGDGEQFPEYTDPRIKVFGFGPFRVVLDNRADPARVAGSVTGPFSDLDGKTLTAAVNLATEESVTLDASQSSDGTLSAGTVASQIAAVMTRVRCYAINKAIVIESVFTGESTTLQIGGSAASALGLSTEQEKGSGSRQATLKAVRDVKGTEETMVEFVLDADQNSALIRAERTLALDAPLIDIKGAQVQINDRIVMPSTKPIQG